MYIRDTNKYNYDISKLFYLSATLIIMLMRPLCYCIVQQQEVRSKGLEREGGERDRRTNKQTDRQTERQRQRAQRAHGERERERA